MKYNLNTITRHLVNSGFIVRPNLMGGVTVKLNRPITSLEVRTALCAEFDDLTNKIFGFAGCVVIENSEEIKEA